MTIWNYETELPSCSQQMTSQQRFKWCHNDLGQRNVKRAISKSHQNYTACLGSGAGRYHRNIQYDNTCRYMRGWGVSKTNNEQHESWDDHRLKCEPHTKQLSTASSAGLATCLLRLAKILSTIVHQDLVQTHRAVSLPQAAKRTVISALSNNIQLRKPLIYSKTLN